MSKENNMKLVQKAITCAAFGVTVSLALGASGGFDPANARNKSSKMEPPPPEKVKPVGEKPVDAPAAEYGVDGQILDRGKGRPITKSAGDAPVDAPPANWEDPKGGQHMDKGRPIAKPAGATGDTPAAAADDPCNRPGVQCDPRDSRDAAKKAKPKGAGGNGRTLGLVAGVSAAIIAGIVLASGGDDSPASP
jgi:hypothetical protein